MLNIFVGYDKREDEAYKACVNSIYSNATVPVHVRGLEIEELTNCGMYIRRSVFPDEVASTDFAFTRFLVPHLMHHYGWGLFVDCDFIFTKCVSNLFALRQEKYAVMCVKHDYIPKTAVKMDGQKQTVYPRKNWSSMMLFNSGHPDCGNLIPNTINYESGAWLHQMMWAKDENIGEVDRRWNWLVGEYDKPDFLPSAIHYTLGGPWFPNYQDVDFAEQYWKYVK